MTKVVTIQAQQKWDYCFESRRTEASLVVVLNELGQQGWDLVEVLNYKDAKGIITWGAFLKRPNAGATATNGLPASASAASPAPAPPTATKSAFINPSQEKHAPLQGFDLDGDEFQLKKE